MKYKKPNLPLYILTQILSWFVATFIFRRKVLRNEIKGKKGAFVVIANHQAALDFVNLIGLSNRRMSFVISNSFYNSLPFKKIMDRIGVIPKQQFQSSVSDLKRIKAVIDHDAPLVIYPAGLMCEDGLSTPIPAATYKFLKWLRADIYVAKTAGTYFAMPKWAKGIRPGRTYLDVYRLFSKEELETLDVETIRERTNEAILFDAYREQETHQVKYCKNDVLEGLEHVLYRCPHCGREFTMEIRDKHTIACTACGYGQTGDKLGFLHNTGGIGREIRYVSDWSREIFQTRKELLRTGQETVLESKTEIRMLQQGGSKFIPVGSGTLHLSAEGFQLTGVIGGEETQLVVPVTELPSLPFSPGKYLELQHGKDIYRCAPEDGRLVMKYIHMLKALYELSKEPAVC